MTARITDEMVTAALDAFLAPNAPYSTTPQRSKMRAALAAALSSRDKPVPPREPPKDNSGPKWRAMTPEQQRYCQFMAFDPDNPDVPLD